jgi:hypothetical protein
VLFEFSQICSSKTDLKNVYKRSLVDKKLCNNLMIEADTERNIMFGIFADSEGQKHDAAFDAYMTGHSFVCISKYIEIGNIIGSKDTTSKRSLTQSKSPSPS